MSASTPASSTQERPERRASTTTDTVISPLSNNVRSSSRAATSRGVSPVTSDSRQGRARSVGRLRKPSPASRNSNAFYTQQQAAHQLQEAKEKLQRSGREGLSLQTRLSVASPPPPIVEPSTPEFQIDPNEELVVEEVVEVISMSPAVATPVRSYRRSQPAATLPRRASSEARLPRKPSLSANPAPYKPTGWDNPFYEMEKCKVEDKSYFGQHINSFDLVANNIERAVEAMR